MADDCPNCELWGYECKSAQREIECLREQLEEIKICGDRPIDRMATAIMAARSHEPGYTANDAYNTAQCLMDEADKRNADGSLM